MAENRTKVDPRFLKYDTPEVEALLDKVSAQQVADEADIRAMVTDYETEESGE